MKTGNVHTIRFQSQLLKRNPMRNRSLRNLVVYTPPSFSRRDNLPCLLFLPGYGSDPTGWLHYDFSFFRLMDLLILSDEVPPAIIAGVDGGTRLGGSQYLDSALNGPYMRYIVEEIVPYLRKHFQVRDGIAITGHSSGGFGALSIASQHPEIFNQVVSFAGDMHFELTHKNILASLVNDVRSGALAGKMSDVLRLKQKHYALGLSAAYSPNLSNRRWRVDLPINLDSGEIDQQVWKKWLALDPIEWLGRRKAALKKLDNILLSAGSRDECLLHIGADTFVRRAKQLDIDVISRRYSGGHGLLFQQMEDCLKTLLT